MSTVRSILGSAVAGLGATLPMEQASAWLYQRENEQAPEAEEQLRAEMPTSVLVRKAAERLGRTPTDQQAQRLGMFVHYLFGASGGPAAQQLTRAGVEPLQAGLRRSGDDRVVDEAANAVLGLTTCPAGFPWQANGRGAAAHAVYGLTPGLMLSAREEDQP